MLLKAVSACIPKENLSAFAIAKRWNAAKCMRTVNKSIVQGIKITCILLLFTCLQVSATGYSQITLSETNTPMRKVLNELEKQSGYDFFYTYEILEEAGNVTVRLNNVSLEKAIEEILKGKNLTYEIIEKTVVIRKKELSAQLQEKQSSVAEINGRVLNENGEPLVGASVKIRGTSMGTSTDAEGNFRINANPGQILVISFVGYNDQEIVVGTSTNISAQLELSVVALNEVVVGYGTRKQQKVTGAVSSVFPLQQIQLSRGNLVQNPGW